MSLISSKMFPIGTGIAFGGEASAYVVGSNVFASAGNFTLPAGDWWIEPNADITLEYSKDGGTTWSSGFATTYMPFIRSDGANVRLVASAATTADFFGPA